MSSYYFAFVWTTTKVMCWPRDTSSNAPEKPWSLMVIFKRTLFGPPRHPTEQPLINDDVVEWDQGPGNFGTYSPPVRDVEASFTDESHKANMLMHDSVISRYLSEPAVLQLTGSFDGTEYHSTVDNSPFISDEPDGLDNQ